MNESEFWDKIDNNEPVYFENQFAEMVYRILPNQDAEGKGKERSLTSFKQVIPT